MGVRFLEHILILSDEPEATRDWWVETLGFEERDHPDFGFPVFWLGIGDRDIVHIAQRNGSDHQRRYVETPDGAEVSCAQADGLGSGRIDHVCFNCEGIEQFTARLDAAAISYSERNAEDSPVYQLFLQEPINGLKVELNFPIEEARRAGRTPGWTNKGAPARA